MPLSCPVAPGRPKLMPGCGPAGRRALAHADTPNTSPGCRSCASAPSPTGARPRRRAADLAALPKRTSHVAGLQTSPRFAPSHTLQRPYEETARVCLSRPSRHLTHPSQHPPPHPAPRPSRAAWAAARVCWAWGFPPLEDVDERLGTMRTATRPSRHRRRPPPSPAPSPTPRPSRARPSRVAQGSGQNARKMSLNRPWACRINNGFKEHCATMKKPFAWGLAGCARDQPCASWVSRSPTSRLNDRRLGLALVVQRSGQVRGSAHA